MSASLLSSSSVPPTEPSGALDIVFDPAPPRPRRRLPGWAWLVAFALWVAGFLGAGLTVVRDRVASPAPASPAGPLTGPLTGLARMSPDGWWHWLVLSGAGAVVGAAVCILQRRR